MRKTRERTIPGVRKKTYTSKRDGSIRVYWQYRVYVPGPDGKLRPEWRNAPSQRAAEAARSERKAEVKRGEAVSATQLTLASYLAEWLPKHAARKRLRPSTLASYETIVNTRIVPLLGAIQLQKLNERHVEQFIYQLETKGASSGKPLARRSVRNTLMVLREALAQARRTRLIPRNPCVEIEGPTIESAQQPQWTPEQARRFLTLLERERFGAIFALTLATGLRRGEVLGLRWEDVDLEAGMIHVRQSLTDVGGKLHFGKPKTQSGSRDLKLPPRVVALLREHRDHQQAQRLAAGARWQGGGAGGDVMFTSARGTPLFPRNVYRRFTALVKAAGLPHTGLHGLRRTASSIAHDGTKDLLAVAQMLGHAQPDVTAKHYRRAAAAALERTAEALDRALFGED